MPCCARIIFVLIRPLVLEGSVGQKLETPFFTTQVLAQCLLCHK